MLTLLTTFGLSALLTHLGVTAAAGTALSGVVGAGAASSLVSAGTKAAGGALANLLHHIAQGGQVTDDQRQWLQAQQGVLYTVPKWEPPKPGGPPQPETWSTPKA